MRFILNRKSMMTFGKWSLVIFSLILLGFFVVQYIFPVLAVSVNYVIISNPLSNTYKTGSITVSVASDTNINATFYYSNGTNIYQYVIGTNTSNSNILTYLWDTTGVVDGTYNFTVNATNSTWTYNLTNTTNGIIIDNTNPILNNTYPANNSYINSANVVFNVSLIEQNINYAVNVTFYYKHHNSSTWSQNTTQCWGTVPSFTCNFSAINLANNPIYLANTESLDFLFNTTDSAGKTGTNGTASIPLTATLDTTQPTSVTGLSHTDDAPTGYDNDTTIIFNWTAATDATSGIRYYKIYVSENAGSYSYNGTNNTPLGYSFTGAGGANYTINVTSVDNAGNENTTGTVSSTITVDTTQPSSPSGVAFQADPSTSYDDDTTLMVNWTAATDTNGILNYKIYVWADLNSSGYLYLGTNSTPLGYSFTGVDGHNYTVNVTAVDNAGIENKTGALSSTTITVDTTNPNNPSGVAFQADPSTSYDNDGTLIVNWTAATDAASGIKQYKIYVSENSGAYVYNGTNSTPLGYSFIGANGATYSVNVTSVDNVDHENTTGATSSTTITVDTTQPSSPSGVAFQADPSTSYDDDTTLMVNWTAATDTNGILNYKIYVWADLNSSGYLYLGTNSTPLGYSFTGVDGHNYTVNVTANDTAHNENATGALSSTTITVDTTNPASINTASPTLANESYTSNNWVYVNITFTETNPDKCILEWNNGTVMNITANPSSSICYWNLTDQPAGNWNYSIYVNDSAGRQGKNTTFAPFYVTVDLTNPIINETVPANSGYFTNPSSMTFQVKLTEQNINNSVNATVYYRRQSVGSYESSALNCYGTAPTWTCNKTGINTGLLNGWVMEFFFNTTDSAGRIGINGTETIPLTATVDTGAPQYSNNGTNSTVIGRNDGIKFYANWTDADGLDTYTLELNDSTDTWNYSQTKFNGGTWSNVTLSNNSWTSGYTITWKMYANDSAGNGNVTVPVTFSIDSTKPISSNLDQNVTNATTIAKGTVLEVRAQWFDGVRLHSYWLSNTSSDGSTWVNGSVSSFTGTTANWTNISIPTSAVTVGTVFEIKIYANDSAGNENVTYLWQYTIDNTPPTYTLNETNVTSGDTIVKGAPINVSALWADGIQLNSGWVQENITTPGTMTNTSITISGNWTNYTFTTSSLTAGSIYSARLFVNDTSGNENYTVPTWTWIIDGTKPTSANKSDSVSGEAAYAPGKTYYLNISWTDNLGNGNVSTALLNFSSLSTNQTATSLGNSNYSYTLTDLGVGNYTYKWYASDTSGNWNETIVYTINITVNTTNPIDIYIQNSTQAYGNSNVTESAGRSITVNGTAVYGNGTILRLYRNDTEVSNPYTFTPTSAAVYTFKANITQTNYTSNSSGTYYLTVTADVTLPTVLLYDYTNATVKKSGAALTLNISVSDATGVTNGETCNVTISSVTNRTITYSNGWCNGTITVPHVSSDGNYIINITVNDNSTNNNMGENSSYVLTVDNTTPVVTITAPTSGTYKKLTSGYIWVNGTAYDIIQMGTGNVSINSSSFTVYNFTGVNNTEFSFRNASAVADGYYAVKINYTDRATNTNEATVYFYVDNTPSTSFTALTTGNKAKSASQNVQVNVTDNLMTNDSITLNYKRGSLDISWQTATMTGTPSTTTTYSATIDTSMLGDGEYVYYYVTGTDNATNPFSTNNGSTTSPLSYFKVGDTTAPQQPTNLAAVQVGSTRQVNITWTASASGDATGYYVYRDTGIVTTSSTNLGEAGNTTKFTDTVPADGTWNYTIVAHDAVPNVNTTITAYATAAVTTTDTTAPNNPASVSVTQFGSTKQINISWSASTSSDVVRYNVYYKLSGALTTSDNSFSTGNVTKASIAVGSDGNWNFTVTAIDSSNNENTTIITSANVTIDTTVPGVSSTSPNGTITDNTPTLIVNTTEAGYCKFDNVDKSMSNMAYTMTGSGTGHEYTFSSALSDSAYTYYVRCNDTIGNEMAATSISFNLDITSLFNITKPEYWSNYFTANKWWPFALPLWTIQSTTLTYYNVTSVLSSVSGNYNNFYADIGNNNTWRSYVPGRAVNSFTDFTYNGSAAIYYIYTNTTDRIEIN